MTTKNGTVKRAALYARVSTLNHEQDPEVQLVQLRQYCQLHGWVITGEYVDSGVSGTKKNRPQLDRLMADAAVDAFDAVLVWRWDRFARSVKHLLDALETFEKLGVAFISTTEGTDTSTPMGKMVFTVLGAVAELERNTTVERIKAGLALAKARGVKLGGPHPGAGRPKGSFKIPDSKLVAQVKMLREKRDKAGRHKNTLREIGQALGISHTRVAQLERLSRRPEKVTR